MKQIGGINRYETFNIRIRFQPNCLSILYTNKTTNSSNFQNNFSSSLKRRIENGIRKIQFRAIGRENPEQHSPFRTAVSECGYQFLTFFFLFGFFSCFLFFFFPDRFFPCTLQATPKTAFFYLPVLMILSYSVACPHEIFSYFLISASVKASATAF